MIYVLLATAAGNVIFVLMEVVNYFRGKKPDGATRWMAIGGGLTMALACLMLAASA